MRNRWKASMALMSAIAMTMLIAQPVSATVPNGSDDIGLEYTSTQGPYAPQTLFVSMVGICCGQNMSLYSTYAGDGNTWAGIINNNGNWNHAAYLQANTHDFNYIRAAPDNLELSVPMCISAYNPDGSFKTPAPGNDLSSNAANIQYYQQLGGDVAAAGWTSTIYRLGWEANGNWPGNAPNQGYCWTQEGGALYKSTFIADANAILNGNPAMGWPGDPTAKFDFNVNAGGPSVKSECGCGSNVANVFQDGGSLDSWYPGSTHVNMIGEDYFCTAGGNGPNDIGVANTMLNGYDMAKAKDKKWAVDEWGTDSACGDDTVFTQTMDDMVLGCSFTNLDPNDPGNVDSPVTVTTKKPDHETYFNDGSSLITSYRNTEATYLAAIPNVSHPCVQP